MGAFAYFVFLNFTYWSDGTNRIPLMYVPYNTSIYLTQYNGGAWMHDG